MVTVIHRKVQTARKEYEDDGWEFMHEWISYGCHVPNGKKITFSEGRLLVAHRRRANPYKIQKGDKYQYQFNRMDGQTYSWRMNQAMYEIACKYSLFPEV